MQPTPRLRAETPPLHYWRRWGGDAPPPAAASAPLPAPPPEPPARLTASPAPADAGNGNTEATRSGDGQIPQKKDDNAPYRVLIVEDDRGQALFAQSVLHGAGMQAEVEMAAGSVLAALQRFDPDLVLMDLHMPDRDGMALTTLIRQQPQYLHLPIVFLTGDPDPERQYQVLESGADDFLTKPIRPRHLIAAVSNRIKRARQRNAPLHAAHATNPETGLPTRSYLLQQLASALEEHAPGGLFFVEIGGALGLRERYGYASFEQLMLRAARQLAGSAAPYPLARLNDNSFLVLARGLAEDALEAFALSLREQLAHAPMQVREETLHLRAVVGYLALPQTFADTGSALEAIERAALQARQRADQVAAYVVPRHVADETRLSLAEATVELAFQPIVSVAGGESAQYQVLMRLRQANGDLLPAAQAVPVAEASGQIVELDREVMRQALELLTARGAEATGMRLFVSQSPRTLARDDMAQWLLGEIAQRGIDGSALVIDLRLADALIHTVTLRDFCSQAMAAGVQFCLGQFEHGLEAEALLSQLPLSYLRVSSRYAGANADPALRDQLRTVIDLAHRAGLQVIGQQIEDPQAAAAMWMGGVDFIQGNLVQGVGSELGFDFRNAVL